MIDVSKSPQKIAAMFDAIAERYDFLNHFLSAGIDKRWRQRAIESLQLTGSETLIDVCTGTGDVAIAAVTHSPAARRVIGADFTPNCGGSEPRYSATSGGKGRVLASERRFHSTPRIMISAPRNTRTSSDSP